MSGNDWAKGLNPRCGPREGDERPIPETLSATMILKPCCYYSNIPEFRELVEWANKHDCDARQDLNCAKLTVDEIKNSPTWKKLRQGLITGDLPDSCFKYCSSNHDNADTKEANNWKKAEN